MTDNFKKTYENIKSLSNLTATLLMDNAKLKRQNIDLLAVCEDTAVWIEGIASIDSHKIDISSALRYSLKAQAKYLYEIIAKN